MKMRITQHKVLYTLIFLIFFSVCVNGKNFDTHSVLSMKNQIGGVNYEIKFGFLSNSLLVKHTQKLKLISHQSISRFRTIGLSQTSMLQANSKITNEKLLGKDMPNITTRSLIAGGLFIPTMTVGYILTTGAKPPNILLLTGHKLTSLANLVLLNYTAYQKHKVTPLNGSEILATIIMNLCFVGTITTGALLSVDTTMPDYVNTLHSITPWATILSSAILMFLLGR